MGTRKTMKKKKETNNELKKETNDDCVLHHYDTSQPCLANNSHPFRTNKM